jgi:hypothetical protein
MAELRAVRRCLYATFFAVRTGLLAAQVLSYHHVGRNNVQFFILNFRRGWGREDAYNQSGYKKLSNSRLSLSGCLHFQQLKSQKLRHPIFSKLPKFVNLPYARC